MLLFAKKLHASMKLWRRNDVRQFGAETILFREIKCKKMDISMFKRCFQCDKICKNKDHTCLFHCINTCRFPRMMFEDSA